MASPPPENLGRAIDLWREAYQQQMKGELDRAIELYQESIRICPTAEAHTFLGWTYSFQGRLDEATQECHRAMARLLIARLDALRVPAVQRRHRFGHGGAHQQAPMAERPPAHLQRIRHIGQVQIRVLL